MKPCDLFSSRDTLEEAYTYSEKLIEALPKEVRGSAYTALWVVLNTAIKALESASPVNLTPREPALRPEAVGKISLLTSRDALLILREELPQLGYLAFLTARARDPIGEPLSLFHALLTRVYELSADVVTAEVMAFAESRLEN